MPKKSSPAQELKDAIARLRDAVSSLDATSRGQISDHARRSAERELADILGRTEGLQRRLDPTTHPAFVLDPGKPTVVARLIALVLLAQPRVPLADTQKSYGSGVYALYYRGSFMHYAPIRGSETPIYVGKAEPERSTAETPASQGIRLSRRLQDHVRTIQAVESGGTLSLADFEQRSLVIQSGWQSAAEEYLIGLFHPIWNRETKICYGFGKHGDAAETRANKRSPWDTLHPGRRWAHHAKLPDAHPRDQIIGNIRKHFGDTRVYQDLDEIVDVFMRDFRQLQP